MGVTSAGSPTLAKAGARTGPVRSGTCPVPHQGLPRVTGIVDRWLREYVSRPHPELGRPGAVCPFVEPALRAGTVLMGEWTGLSQADHDAVREVVRSLVVTFEETRWPHANATMHTLLAVLPDLPEPLWFLLDDVQAEVKADLAGRGLMLGQFHPACPEPAARNPRFAVSRSPVPLLALRRMALHDVLFLHQDRRFFAAYRVRFGERYERGTVSDPAFRAAYRRGVADFGSPVGEHIDLEDR